MGPILLCLVKTAVDFGTRFPFVKLGTEGVVFFDWTGCMDRVLCMELVEAEFANFL